MLHNTYMVRLELGYTYITSERLKEAEAINTILWKETQLLAPEARRTFYADALRNMGYLYCVQGNYSIARKRLREALQEYRDSFAPSKLKDFGSARAQRHLADCYGTDKRTISAAIDCLNRAKDLYLSSVGLDHPEAQECLDKLDQLKLKNH